MIDAYSLQSTMSFTHLCAMLRPAWSKQVRNKHGRLSWTQRITSICIAFVFVLFTPVRNLVNLIAATQIKISSASDWITGDLSGVCKQATLSKFSMKAFDSNIAHRCNCSFGIFVRFKDLTVIEISWIQSQPVHKTYTHFENCQIKKYFHIKFIRVLTTITLQFFTCICSKSFYCSTWRYWTCFVDPQFFWCRWFWI